MSRIRSRSWFFTYNNYPKEALAQLSETFQDWKVAYVFQEEEGENKTPHIQGCIRFDNPTGINFQERLPNVIHWERCRNWRNATKYCCKRTTRIGDKVYTNVKNLPIRNRIEDFLSRQDVELYTYQKRVIELALGPVHPREIYWFWEPKGNTGKSTLVKHLVLKHDALLLGSNSRDCYFALAKRDAERDIKIVVFDINRASYNNISYNALESTKNGLAFSGKYESCQICFNTPHVFVFCNFEPDYSKLSLDRWKIHQIRMN